MNYRAEDAARYLLGFAPIIALVSSVFLVGLYEFFEKNYKYVGVIFIIFVIAYCIFGLRLLGIRGYGIVDKLLGYDQTAGLINIKQFSSSFFEACDWIKANTPKNSTLMTVWVWHTTYNCQRNVIGNLADLEMSQDLNFSLDVIKKFGITHIFIQDFSLSNKYLSESYNVNFIQFLESNPTCFNKIYEKPSLQQCLQQGGCDGAVVYEVNKECLK